MANTSQPHKATYRDVRIVDPIEQRRTNDLLVTCHIPPMIKSTPCQPRFHTHLDSEEVAVPSSGASQMQRSFFLSRRSSVLLAKAADTMYRSHHL